MGNRRSVLSHKVVQRKYVKHFVHHVSWVPFHCHALAKVDPHYSPKVLDLPQRHRGSVRSPPALDLLLLVLFASVWCRRQARMIHVEGIQSHDIDNVATLILVCWKKSESIQISNHTLDEKGSCLGDLGVRPQKSSQSRPPEGNLTSESSQFDIYGDWKFHCSLSVLRPTHIAILNFKIVMPIRLV